MVRPAWPGPHPRRRVGTPRAREARPAGTTRAAGRPAPSRRPMPAVTRPPRGRPLLACAVRSHPLAWPLPPPSAAAPAPAKRASPPATMRVPQKYHIVMDPTPPTAGTATGAAGSPAPDRRRERRARFRSHAALQPPPTPAARPVPPTRSPSGSALAPSLASAALTALTLRARVKSCNFDLTTASRWINVTRMHTHVTPDRPRRNERGKRIWLPGSGAQLRSVATAARARLMRPGQYLMSLHLAAQRAERAPQVVPPPAPGLPGAQH